MGSLPSFPSACDIMHSFGCESSKIGCALSLVLLSLFSVSVCLLAGGREGADKNTGGMTRHLTHTNAAVDLSLTHNRAPLRAHACTFTAKICYFCCQVRIDNEMGTLPNSRPARKKDKNNNMKNSAVNIFLD
jgi:hypothetical protein